MGKAGGQAQALCPSLCVPAAAPSRSRGAQFVPARVPVPSAVRAARAGPGAGLAWLGTGRCPCMSPPAEPRHLPRHHSAPRCPSQSRRWFPVQQRWDCAKVPGWGFGAGINPGHPARSRGIRTPFSRASAPGRAGTPDPAGVLSPLVHVASAGRARAARTPPIPSPRPGGATRGDSAGWGRGACDSFARSRTQELTLRIPPHPGAGCSPQR